MLLGLMQVSKSTIRAPAGRVSRRLTGVGLGWAGSATGVSLGVVGAVVDPSAFGQIPNAETAFNTLQTFVTQHAEAMAQMGVSLADFIARVQAAAKLGYDADPATKAQAAYARAHHGPVQAE